MSSNFLIDKSLVNEQFRDEKEYWLGRLSGEWNLCSFNFDRIPADERRFEKAVMIFDIPLSLSANLNKLSNGSDQRNFILLNAGLIVMLYKHTGMTDIITGFPVLKQENNGILNETLVIRAEFSPDTSFKELILELQKDFIQANKNANFPLSLILEELSIPEKNNASRLFDVLLLSESIHPGSSQFYKLDNNFSLAFRDQNTKHQIEIFYNPLKYTNQNISMLFSQYCTIMENALAAPDLKIKSIEMLTPFEKNQLLYDFNSTQKEFSRDLCIHSCFEKQVEKNPDSIALLFEDKTMSYREVNEKANALASFLKKQGVMNQCYIAIFLERSFEMIIAVMAVLKAGGVYVPFEIAHPDKRIAGIINNLNIEHIITDYSRHNRIHQIKWQAPSLKHVYYPGIAGQSLDVEKINESDVQSMWDHVIDISTDYITAAGFYSSYTGKPFIDQEVTQYQNHIKKIAFPFLDKSKSLLEIGCGSGLIMSILCRHVDCYTGIDPSAAALQKNSGYINSHQLTNVRLLKSFAHEIDDIADLKNGSIDIVIIASTVQFFPGLLYLEQVINKIIKLLRPGGVLIMADILDWRQKEQYRQSVEEFSRLAGNPPDSRTKSDWDDELYIADEYFYNLLNINMDIQEVEVLPRFKGLFENELRFRYDVILKKTNNTARDSGYKNYFTSWTASHFQESTKSLSPVKSSDLAYIIYTSGTSGIPKGVAVTHTPVINLIEWVNRTFCITPNDRLLFVTSLCFDLSVYDIFGILAAGASLRIASREELEEPDKLIKRMATEDLTFWDSAPAVLAQLIPMLDDNKKLFNHSKFRLFFLSGDWIPLNLPVKISEIFDQSKVIGLGGATEAAVWSNYYPVSTIDPAWVSIPYGKPIQNACYYILDNDMNPCPIGVPGDLYIGGECLASCYINDEQLTRQKFIPNPYNRANSPVIYKTGDTARWFIDGNIEFLGRKDQQVKIRGYRIELGEIESVLIRFEKISGAVAVVHEIPQGNKVICAYYISDSLLSYEELKNWMVANVPPYMIPSFFIKITQIPLTPNGKLDRKALPLPQADSSSAVQLPCNENQEKLALIWKDLLGLNEIDIYQDFFRTGGDSLKAAIMLSRIHKEFNVKINLREIFLHHTIKELEELILKTESVDYSSIQPVKTQDYYPVSAAQRRMYIYNQMQDARTTYNLPGVTLVRGNLKIDQLERIFNEIINRHESLRTSFILVNNEPVQKIHNYVDFSIQVERATGHSLTQGDIENLLRNFIRPFNLEKPPLFRVKIIEESPVKFYLMYDFHHIIADGFSSNIFINDFINLFNNASLPEIKVQYKDFSAWQNKFFSTPIFRKQREYWLKEFRNEVPVLEITGDYPRPAKKNFEGDIVYFTINTDTTARLHSLTDENNVTIFMILFACYSLLLVKYSGQDDLVIGTPVSGRNHADVENIIGMFVNTLAVRFFAYTDKTFLEYLQSVRVKLLEAFENQDFPLDELVDNLDLFRDLGRNPLFDTFFVFQNFNLDSGMNRIEIDQPESIISFNAFPVNSGITKFDLTMSLMESKGVIKGQLEFCTKLFKKNKIQSMTNRFILILDLVCANPAVKLGDIEIITPQEKKLLIEQYNSPLPMYLGDLTLHGLFEKQATLTPFNIAVSMEDNKISYRELDERANQLAHCLMEKGIVPETITGLLFYPCIEMIVALFAVLKAGGAYLPIDPDYPVNRINSLFDDSKPYLLLTTNSIKQNPGLVEVFQQRETVCVDDRQILSYPVEKPKSIVVPDNLCYVIYTSGTTGTPKGVMIEHKSIVQTIVWRKEEYKLSGEDNVLQLFSYSFDGFLTSFFTPLSCGAKAVLVAKETARNPLQITDIIEKEQITHFIVIPTMYAMLLNFLTPEKAKSLRIITLAGEKITEALAAKSRQLHENLEIVNEYGPTENSVATSFARGLQKSHDITIGKPVTGCHVYILDKRGRFQPPGIIGELCIGGTKLARGYLNNTQLSNAKFIMPGNNSLIKERIYLTGDLACWNQEGNIEFIGRMDEQVKISGYRIELGEISACIEKIPSITKATVVSKEKPNGVSYLCAYYTSANTIEPSAIQDHLVKELPSYMIPAFFIQVKEFPFNNSGKINNQALPMPKELTTSTGYKAPTTQVETSMVKIWQDIFEINKIGITDDFFELGGQSIIAAIIVEMCRKEQIFISFDDVLRYKTIEKILSNTDYTKNPDINQDGEFQPSELKNDLDAFLSDFDNEDMFMNFQQHEIESSTGLSIRELPVVLQKDVTTLFLHALPACIILAYPNYIPWYYRYNIKICSQENFMGYLTLDFEQPIRPFTEIMDHLMMGYDSLKDEKDIVNFFINQIQEGYYIVACMDEYYLQARSHYQKRHYVHESLIYGYDKNKEIFFGIGFNNYDIFDKIIFKFNEVAHGFESGKLYYKETAPYAEEQVIQIIKPRETDKVYPFDLELFVNDLEDLLYSRADFTKVTFICIPGADWLPQNGLLNNDKIEFGLNVYDKVIKLLKKLEPGDVIADYRPFHFFCEHARGLYNRVEFMIQNYNFSTQAGSILEEYKVTVDLLESVRIKVMQILRSGIGTLEPVQFSQTINQTITHLSEVKQNTSDWLTRIIGEIKNYLKTGKDS